MGAAMGYAATQPPQISLLVFVALGLGFAAPFFLLSVAPPLRGFLPRPGAWMETFKQFLAFPMFAASIWLVWVLSQQAGGAGLLALLAAFLAFGFLVWALRAFRGRGARVATAALAVAALAAAGFGVHAARAVSPGAGAARGGRLAIQTWTPAREAALRAEGKAVFVNFTAAWCVTCQVNERVALQSSDVAAAFARGGVAYLKADWTARDPVIAGALKAQGRAGVPLYLYYAPRAGVDAPPVVLPQLLTPAIVVAAIDAAPSTSAPSKGAR
jgi:thiol:disulfide interchange protein DsbD